MVCFFLFFLSEVRFFFPGQSSQIGKKIFIYLFILKKREVSKMRRMRAVTRAPPLPLHTSPPPAHTPLAGPCLLSLFPDRLNKPRLCAISHVERGPSTPHPYLHDDDDGDDGGNDNIYLPCTG